MPITYEVDEARRIVLSRMQGHVTADELISTAQEAMKDHRIGSGFSHLIDMEMILSLEVPSDVVSSTAHATNDGGFLHEGKTAIVASKDLHFALGRMYQMYASSSGRTIEVFRAREEADRWLGIEDGPSS